MHRLADFADDIAQLLLWTTGGIERQHRQCELAVERKSLPRIISLLITFWMS